MVLHIDFETYSETDLKKCGLYQYMACPSFEILLGSFKIEDAPVFTIDFANGEEWPAEVLDMLKDPEILKVAHNAAFEMEAIDRVLGSQFVDPGAWFCTMINAGYMGLPFKLDDVANILGTPVKKDAAGARLIRYFSLPCRPTKTNGGRTRNLPHHDPEEWERYKDYNRDDVEAEYWVHKYLERFKNSTDTERVIFVLDRKINKRGVLVDERFIRQCIKANESAVSVDLEAMRAITGLDNPNSNVQLCRWLSEELGREITTVAKNEVNELLKEEGISLTVRRVLELRQRVNNTSISKYEAMLNYAGVDGRCRGTMQLNGAWRTARFAGRGIQPQNLKRTPKANLKRLRDAAECGILDILVDDVSGTISELTRTAIIAAPGKSLVSADFSAIEARVLAWLAGETWVLDVFKTHGKIYEMTAARMFGVPFESVDGELRQKGKVADLALGYQGGVGALVSMGALRSGIKENELPGLVAAYRQARRNTVALWKKLEHAAFSAVQMRGTFTLNLAFTVLTFIWKDGVLFVELPSGRKLAYQGAHIGRGKKVCYWGVGTYSKKWEIISAHGGLWAENFTQAIARDCLVETLIAVDAYGVNTIMHVHDEIVSEEADERAEGVLNLILKIMRVSPFWAPTLPLGGAGYISKFYKKD